MFFFENLKCFTKILFCGGKKMLSSLFSNIRNLVFDQSSPVQPVAELGGGLLSVTEEEKKEEKKKEILVSNIGLQFSFTDSLVGIVVWW